MAYLSQHVIEVWGRLLAGLKLLETETETAFAEAGLPELVVYRTLSEIEWAGGNGLSQRALGEALAIPKHQLSRLIERLVRAGYVRQEQNKYDGRGKWLWLRPRGGDLLGFMWPVYAGVIERELKARLTAREISELSRLLDKLGL